MVERPRRRPQTSSDRSDRYSGWTLCGGDGHSRGEKVLLAEFGMTHVSRIGILDRRATTSRITTRVSYGKTSKVRRSASLPFLDAVSMRRFYQAKGIR